MKKVSIINKPAPGKAGRIGAVILGGDFQALGIVRSLGQQKIPTYVLDKGSCIGRFSRYTGKFARCPDVKDGTSLFDFLVNLAEKEGLQGWLLYPNDDETVRFLSRNKERLEKYYRVTTPPWEVVRYASEKRLTYELAEQHGIPVPRTFYPAGVDELEQADLVFPLIIKPSIKEPFYSTTGKKAIRIDSKKELIEEFIKVREIAGNSEIMVQQLIPGGTENLYSVGCFFQDGRIRGRVVARRLRQHPMDFGHATTYAETVDLPVLEQLATGILEAMNYSGLAEVEFMRDPGDGQYKLIEINPRPWGWHTLALGAGVNLHHQLYQHMVGEEISQNGVNMRPVKWIRLVTDTPTAAMAVLKGQVKFTEYIRSLRGRKQFAVFSFRDPLPFIVELLMLPYLWKKRGF